MGLGLVGFGEIVDYTVYAVFEEDGVEIYQ
jgi:hypothetical protein